MSWGKVINEQPFGERIWLTHTHVSLMEDTNDVVVLVDHNHYQSTHSDLYRLRLLRVLCELFFNCPLRHLYVMKNSLAFQTLLDNNARIVDVSKAIS